MRSHVLISLGMRYISGLEYPAYVESVPVSFITDERGGQIAVVPLDKEVDHTKVYINPNDDDDDDNNEEEGAGKADDNETAAPLDVEDVEIIGIDDDDDDDKSDFNVDDDDDDEGNDHVDDDDGGDGDNDDDSDDDYCGDEDEDDYDDDDDDDDMDDSDYEFIPKSNVKLVVENKSTDDDTVMGEGDHREKQTVHRKRKPNIKEIAIVDADNGSGTCNSIFDVHLCQLVVVKCSPDWAVMVTWLLSLSSFHLGVFGLSSGW